jgi:hypothetical protein
MQVYIIMFLGVCGRGSDVEGSTLTSPLNLESYPGNFFRAHANGYRY